MRYQFDPDKPARAKVVAGTVTDGHGRVSDRVLDLFIETNRLRCFQPSKWAAGRPSELKLSDDCEAAGWQVLDFSQ